MKFTTFILFVLGNMSLINAQNLTISGLVKADSTEVLAAATVVLLSEEDSVMVAFSITNESGKFKLSQLKAGSYILQASYTGLSNFSEKIELSNSDFDLPDIVLLPSDEVLQEVKVVAKHIPIGINGDTISYNANAFKVGPGATVEDLLKRLPGIEVERDGTIKAQGEDVEEILVDGKEFFSGDPTIATKNLDAEAVSKIDVFDKKSDLETFTGIDDGVRSRTINLELKEDYKKGGFGKADLNAGGLGFKYDEKLNYFRFNDKLQASIISYANNVNKQTMSLEEQIEFMGGISGLLASGGALIVPNDMGIPEGENHSVFSGLQFNYIFSKKTEIKNRYSIRYGKNDLDKKSENISFGQGVEYTTSDTTQSENNTFANIFHSELTHKASPYFHFIFNNDINWNFGNRQTNTISYYAQENISQGFVGSNNQDKNNQFGIDSKVTLQSKFKKNKSSWINVINPQFNLVDRQLKIDNTSSLQPGFTAVTQNQNLQSRQTLVNLNSTFTKPIAKKMSLSFYYDFNYENEQPQKNFFDIVNNSEVRNDSLGAEFTENIHRHQPGFALKRSTEHFNFSIHLASEFLQVKDRFQNIETLNQTHFYFTPSLSIKYNKKLHMFDFNYNTSVNLPDIYQLLPVINNVDPQVEILGNSDLKPEYSHSALLSYNYFNQFNLINIFSHLSINLTQNNIIDKTEFGSDLVRRQQPINSSHSFVLNSSVGLSAPLKPLRIRTNLNYNTAFSQYEYVINDVIDIVHSTNHQINFRLSNSKQEKILVEPGLTIDFNSTKYSVSKSFDTKTTNTNFHLDVYGYLPKKWTISSFFTIKNFNSNRYGENPKFFLLTAELQKFFKEERWSIKAQVVDILDQNRGFNRTSDANSIRQTRFNTVGRHFLVGVTVKLKKKLKEEG